MNRVNIMWYGDTVWPTLIALGTVAAILGILWWDRRKPLFLIGALVCVPVAIAAIVIERRIVTPREQVTARLEQLIGDFEKQNAAAVIDAISTRAPDIRQLASRAVEKVTIENVRISDVNVEISGEDVLRARTHFRVTADVMFSGLHLSRAQRQPTRWKATWEQEADGKWRMLDLDQLDPLTGEAVFEAKQYVN
jgi:hypothetical protein